MWRQLPLRCLSMSMYSGFCENLCSTSVISCAQFILYTGQSCFRTCNIYSTVCCTLKPWCEALREALIVKIGPICHCWCWATLRAWRVQKFTFSGRSTEQNIRVSLPHLWTELYTLWYAGTYQHLRRSSFINPRGSWNKRLGLELSLKEK